MVSSCSAQGCSNKHHKEKNISFHGFPKNPTMLKKWLVGIHRKNFNPGSGSKVCSEHFQPDDFVINFGRKTLKSDAIPSMSNMSKCRKKKPVKLRSQRLLKAENEKVSSSTCISNEVTESNQDIKEIHCNVDIVEENAKEAQYPVDIAQKNACEKIQCTADSSQETVMKKGQAVQSTVDIVYETVPVTAHQIQCIIYNNISPDIASQNANVCMNNTISGINTLPTKRRRSVPAYIGDIEPGDLDDPKKFKLMWLIATKTITKQRKTIKQLRTKIYRSDKKLRILYDHLVQLQNSNS